MFPLELFDEIFNSIENTYSHCPFKQRSWGEVRDLTLSRAVRKIHLAESQNMTTEAFLKRLIFASILARRAEGKNQAEYAMGRNYIQSKNS